MKKRKIISVVLASLMVTTMFAGCGTKSGQSNQSGSAATTKPAEPITIKVSCWDKATMPEFKTAIDAFTAKNSNIKVDIIDKPSAEYTNNLSVMLNGGSDLDAFWIKDADTMLSIQKKGQLTDLSDYIKKNNVDLNIYNGLAKNMQFDGKTYGLPFRSDYYVLFYNKNLFDAAKVAYPTNDMTWEDFEALAKKLTSGSGADKKYGALIHTWQACVENWGVQDGQHTILDTSTGYDFFKPYYEMALRMQKDGTIPDYASLKSGNIHYSSPFMKGDVAMLPMGTWFMSTLIQKTTSGENKANWAVATLPHPKGVKAGNTVGSVTPLVINQASSKKDAAWEFVKFATGDEGATALSKIGSIPALTNASITANIAAVKGMPANLTDALKVTNISLDRPIAPKVVEVNKMLGEQHDLIMLGEKTIDQGLAEMAKQSKELQSNK